MAVLSQPSSAPIRSLNWRLSPQIMCPGRQAATTLGQNLCLCRKRILQPKNARPLDDAAFTPTSQSVHKLASPFRRRRTRRQGGSRRAPPATLRARCRRAVARPPQPREAWWRAGRAGSNAGSSRVPSPAAALQPVYRAAALRQPVPPPAALQTPAQFPRRRISRRGAAPWWIFPRPARRARNVIRRRGRLRAHTDVFAIRMRGGGPWGRERGGLGGRG